MTDPDLIFDLDPSNVQRIDEWLSELCPDAAMAKEGDGSRLTWMLAPPTRGALARVVATESFLSMPAEQVDQLLAEARALCDRRSAQSLWYLLLTIDGVRAVELPNA